MTKRIVSPKAKWKCAIKAAQPGPPGAQLVYNGGPLLSNIDIVSIYWGGIWLTDPLMAKLESFFSFVPTSSLVLQLQEYNVPGFTIGNGVHNQSVVIQADPGLSIDDSAIQSELLGLIANGTVKSPTANTLYCFNFPSGTTVTGNQIGIGSSCIDFCGYHNNIGSDAFGGPFYAVLPYQDCSGCIGIAGNITDSSTVVMWHEIAEAITDPIPGAGWYDNLNGEIGDICEGGNKVITTAKAAGPALLSYTSPGPQTDANGVITVVLTPAVVGPPPPPPPPPGGPWTVQLLWSNAQNACV